MTEHSLFGNAISVLVHIYTTKQERHTVKLKLSRNLLTFLATFFKHSFQKFLFEKLTRWVNLQDHKLDDSVCSIT